MKLLNENRRGALIGLLVILGLMLAHGLAAEPRIATGPIPMSAMEAQGVMEYVDPAGKTIKIDGRVYPMSPDTLWYGLRPEDSLISQLSRLSYREVGYIVNYQGQVPVVDAVWVLPKDNGEARYGQ